MTIGLDSDKKIVNSSYYVTIDGRANDYSKSFICFLFFVLFVIMVKLSMIETVDDIRYDVYATVLSRYTN